MPVRRLFAPMPPRDPEEVHRAATPLELFFDLVFVVAVAAAAGQLHHAISADHVADGLLNYALVFFAIWWAWMGFTWFATTYDTDDVPYRIVIFIQITGALMLAAGVPDAFGGDWTVVTYGFVVMRAAMVFQWLRAAAHHPEGRAAAYRYAMGITVMQIYWVALLQAPPEYIVALFVGGAIGELAVPVWASRAIDGAPWHDGHIAERYGLFTIIVLGESILAASAAIDTASDASVPWREILPTIIGGLLVVFSLWWLYFGRPMTDRLANMGSAFFWGYGHYFIFGSGAAVGAGLAVLVDYDTGHAEISCVTAGYALAVPVAIFLISLWAMHFRPGNSLTQHLVLPIGVVAVLLTPYSGEPALACGLILAVALGFKLYRYYVARLDAGEDRSAQSC